MWLMSFLALLYDHHSRRQVIHAQQQTRRKGRADNRCVRSRGGTSAWAIKANQLATSQVAERASERRQRFSVPSSSTSSLASPPCGRIMCSVDRAKLVLGDIDESAAQSVAAEIKHVGG